MLALGDLTLADGVAGLIYCYLFFVFLKEGLKRERDVRSFWLVLAFFVLPLVAATHFVGRWDFSTEAWWNLKGRWWCWEIPSPEKGGPSTSFNVITAGLVIAVLFTVATALIGVFSWYYRIKRRNEVLAIHRVLIKLAVILVGLAVYLRSENISLTPLWVGMGAASIVVGIALQEPLSNLFTGVALDIEGVLKQGQWIRFGGPDGVVGRVVEKNWRTTKLLTNDDEYYGAESYAR